MAWALASSRTAFQSALPDIVSCSFACELRKPITDAVVSHLCLKDTPCSLDFDFLACNLDNAHADLQGTSGIVSQSVVATSSLPWHLFGKMRTYQERSCAIMLHFPGILTFRVQILLNAQSCLACSVQTTGKRVRLALSASIFQNNLSLHGVMSCASKSGSIAPIEATS